MDSDKETGFFTKSAGNNEGTRKKPGFWATSQVLLGRSHFSEIS
jgi:hypothetical protein